MKKGNIILLLSGVVAAFLLIPKRKVSQLEETIDQTETEAPAVITQQGSNDLVPVFCDISFQQNAGTQNFNISEFHSKDGTAVPFLIRGNVQVLMTQLETIRSSLNAPIIITSGYRTPEHNENVNGVSSSYHQCGMAADFKVPGYSNNEVQEKVLQLIDQGLIKNGGVGRYNSFTHYDIGPSRRW